MNSDGYNGSIHKLGGRSQARARPYSFEKMPTDDVAETEGERQLKRLLNQQLDKNITLKMQFERHRDFKASAHYESFTKTLSGQLSSQEFLVMRSQRQRIDYLKQLGLDDAEIYLKLQNDGFDGQEHGKVQKEPFALKQQLEVISDKIERKNTELNQHSAFREAKQLTRHEMDLERSLKPNCQQARLYSSLVTYKKAGDDGLHPDDPLNYLKEMEQELTERIDTAVDLKRRQCRPKRCSDLVGPVSIGPSLEPGLDATMSGGEQQLTEKIGENSECGSTTVFKGKIISISEEDIVANRLTTEKIRELRQFHSYQPGNPSNTLFIKNLANAVDDADLIALFGRFQTAAAADPIQYRRMNGKMKGQAFITFPDTCTAEKALHLVHGFVWKGKPIVIQYGRTSVVKAP